MDSASRLAATLVRLRKQNGLNQQALADRAGVSRMTIQRIEAGQDVRLHTLLDVLHALDMDVMFAPQPLLSEIDFFIAAGGKVLGMPPGPDSPRSLIDDIRRELEQP